VVEARILRSIRSQEHVARERAANRSSAFDFENAVVRIRPRKMRDGNAFGGTTARWSWSLRDDSSVGQEANWTEAQRDPRCIRLLRGIRLIDSHPYDGCPKRQDRQGNYGERAASHLALEG
jgi:hypothetical protein